MTKDEWYTLISKEFNVSRNIAKTMFHSMVQTYEVKKPNTTMAEAFEKAGIKC